MLLLTTCVVIYFSYIFYGCKKDGDPYEISNDTYQSPMFIQFNNGDTNSTTIIPDFTLTIFGKDAASVVTPDGGTSFTVYEGVINLALRKDVIPSASNPVVFGIKANVPGFAPILQTFSITDSLDMSKSINLLELLHPFKGVGLVSQNDTITSGTVSRNISIVTNTNTGMAKQATISIPTGTDLIDANGAKINASNLQSNVIYYGGEVGNNIPNSLTAATAVDRNGNAITGGINFITAGCASINLSASGTAVKSFSNPINVTMELSDGLINISNGNTYAVGDSIPLWSLDENTGIWKEEHKAVVVMNSNGNLTAQFAITHLSSWNLDWSWAQNLGTCNHRLDVKIHNISGTYDVTLIDANGNYLGANHSEYLQDGDVVTFVTTPQISNARVVISRSNLYPRSSPTDWLFQTNLFNPCSVNSIDIGTIGTVPVTPSLVDVKINCKILCTDLNILLNMSGWFCLKNASGKVIASRYAYARANSSATFKNIPTGVPLIASFIFKRKLYKQQITLQKQNYPNWGASVGLNTITASATYDTATNTLKGACQINVKCQ